MNKSTEPNNPLADLHPVFAKQIEELNKRCLEKGVIMCLWEGLRNPYVQGQYWAQSRTEIEIQKQKKYLQEQKAFFIDRCIPAYNNFRLQQISNAIPGFSWHQWGEAVDMVWIVNGRPCWSLDILVDGVNGNQVYAEEASLLGLESGLYWPNFTDAFHVQMRKEPSPSILYDIDFINAKMEEMFGHLGYG